MPFIFLYIYVCFFYKKWLFLQESKGIFVKIDKGLGSDWFMFLITENYFLLSKTKKTIKTLGLFISYFLKIVFENGFHKHRKHHFSIILKLFLLSEFNIFLCSLCFLD